MRRKLGTAASDHHASPSEMDAAFRSAVLAGPIFASTGRPRPDTWGLSGPTFLMVFVALTAAVVLVVFLTRGRVLAGGAGPPLDQTTVDPCELAMVNEGETLAVAAAVAELRRLGAIQQDQDSERLIVVSESRHGLDRLESAVLDYLRETPSTMVEQIAAAPTPASTLAMMRERLVAEGLLLTSEQRRRIRWQAGWVVALIGLGVTRIAAGALNHKPVGLLIVLVGVLALVVLPWSLRAPNASTRGRRLLRSARKQERDLKKEIGAADPRLGLAVALFGSELMWSAEPSLAQALGLPRNSGGNGGGGGCGGGCGGCGG